MLALALALLVQGDPVAAAATGLTPAEIEDDKGPDMPFLGATSAGCTITLRGQDRTFALDMSKVEGLARENTFVFVQTDEHKLAIVADVSKPDQAAKLDALAQAMIAVANRCMKQPS